MKKSLLKAIVALLAIVAVCSTGACAAVSTSQIEASDSNLQETNATGSKNTLDLNVVSFNIRYITSKDTGAKNWNERSGPLAEYLVDLDADIVCMQESASKKWFRFLKDSLRESYAVYQGSNGKSGGVVTALRLDAFDILDYELFWLSETPSKLSIGWDAKHPRVCQHFLLSHKKTGIVFNVFNTHLDHVGEIAPVRSIEMITQRIKESDYPSILTGDFNEYEFSETYQIATSILQDTQKTAPETDSGRTYNRWGNNPDDGFPVDFIMVSPSATPLSFRICRERWNEVNFYSDHYAVQSIIQLTN